MKKMHDLLFITVISFLIGFLITSWLDMRIGNNKYVEMTFEDTTNQLSIIGEPADVVEEPPVRVTVMNTDNYILEVAPVPYLHCFNEDDVDIVARTIYGEAGGIGSKMEQAAVAWCILNRVDRSNSTVKEVVTPGQFHGYIYWGSCPDEFYELATDVLQRWEREKNGEKNVGRVLPSDYYYFYGDGKHNHFRKKYEGGTRWDWSLWNPYES